MPGNENTNGTQASRLRQQIKSRQRVADHGEVFTNPREVNAMLDQRGGIAFFEQSKIEKNILWISKYKIFISKAYNAGDDFPHQILNKPVVGESGTCCTETYILIGPLSQRTKP